MLSIGKLFGKDKAKAAGRSASASAECLHALLAPKWDSAADIGVEEKASRFVCDACRASFTPEEARDLRSSLAERMRVSEERAGA